MADEPRFLSVGDVLAIHEDTIREEGGLPGVRDLGLLISAVMMPQQRFAGAYVHDGVAAMAAAYLFHIARNHPFHDGNKRAGVLAALVFLEVNGVTRLPDPVELERVTLAVAASETTKDELTSWLRSETAQ